MGICRGPDCHTPNLSQTPGCSVAQSCLTLCYSEDCSTPGFPVLHCLPEFTQKTKLMSSELVMPSNHLILCHLLLLLPSIFPSIRVFSSESALCIKWPKYWSFSFSISPSSENSHQACFLSVFSRRDKHMCQDIPPFRNDLRSGCSSLSYSDYHSFTHSFFWIHHLVVALFLWEVQSCQGFGFHFSV